MKAYARLYFIINSTQSAMWIFIQAPLHNNNKGGLHMKKLKEKLIGIHDILQNVMNDGINDHSAAINIILESLEDAIESIDKMRK